jgi:hypothetical protein
MNSRELLDSIDRHLDSIREQDTVTSASGVLQSYPISSSARPIVEEYIVKVLNTEEQAPRECIAGRVLGYIFIPALGGLAGWFIGGAIDGRDGAAAGIVVGGTVGMGIEHLYGMGSAMYSHLFRHEPPDDELRREHLRERAVIKLEALAQSTTGRPSRPSV